MTKKNIYIFGPIKMQYYYEKLANDRVFFICSNYTNGVTEF